MKILIELPSWLGDAIMSTPAIENIINIYKDVKITLIGPEFAIEALKNHPNVSEVTSIQKNYIKIISFAKRMGEYDIFISFRGSMRAKILKFYISANRKYQFNKKKYQNTHQVEKYSNFVNDSLNINSSPGRLVIYPQKKLNKVDSNKKILGINPGATYGNAKRWYPEKFSEVAFFLSDEYDILIFGGPNEIHIARDIESLLLKRGVTNFKNLADKTNIQELINQFQSLDLLITGDSGPMHIAAALEVPTVSIFGPTNKDETSQWQNKKSIVINKKLECQPCMKRECPLKHHNCMKMISELDVLNAIKQLK